MTAFSKLMGRCDVRMSTYNCYETAHPWQHSCPRAWLDLARWAFVYSVKTYAPLYLVSDLARLRSLQLLRAKKIAGNTLRSSVFLTANVVTFMMSICAMRRLFGVWTIPLFGLAQGLTASFLAILLERPSRRPLLALYLTNLASEIAYRMLAARGIVPLIPKAEIGLFAVALAYFMYLYRLDELDGDVRAVLKFCFHLTDREVFDADALPARPCDVVRRLRAYAPPTAYCGHKHSCASNAIEKALRNFIAVYIGGGALRLLGSGTGLLSTPLAALRRAFLTRSALSLPLFAALMPGIYHSAVCLAHAQTGRPSTPLAHGLAGALGGLAMYCWPNVNVAMYALWKAIEILYDRGRQRGWAPPPPKYAAILLYTLSTGFVLFAACAEAPAIRPGYWRFLQELTGHKLGTVYRRLFNEFGMRGARFDTFRPQLDPVHTSINPVFLP